MANRYLKLDITTATGVANTVINLNHSATERDGAMSFTADYSGPLKFLELSVIRASTPTGTLTLELYSGNTFGSGSLLGVSNSLDISTFGTTAGYFQWIFATNPRIVSSNAYWIKMICTSAISSTVFVKVQGTSTDTYAGGNAGKYNGSTWDSLAPADVQMKIYSDQDGGVFDCPDSVSTSTLRTTVKGAAIAASDSILVYNGATYTEDENYSRKVVWVGKSVGATGTTVGDAAVGQRNGSVTRNPGLNCVWGGDGTNTNSGYTDILTGAADVATKSNTLTIGTPSGARSSDTNASNSVDTTQRWMVNWVNGRIVAYNWDGHNSYAAPFVAIAMDSSKTTLGPIINNCTFDGFAASCNLFTTPNTGLDLAIDLRANSIDLGTNSGSAYLLQSGGTSCRLISGGSIDISGCYFKGNSVAAGTAFSLTAQFNGNSGQYYAGTYKFSFSDIRPTQLVPTSLVLTNLQNGTAKIEVANIASLPNDTDELKVFLADGTPLYTISKAKYIAALGEKPANCGLTASLQIGTTYSEIYAKYTSDLATFGNASTPAADVTVTFLPGVGDVRAVGYGQGGNKYLGTLVNLVAADAAYGALENSRNDAGNAVAGDTRTGKNYKVKNNTINGSIPQTDIMPASGGTSDKKWSDTELVAANTAYQSANNTLIDTAVVKLNEDIYQFGAHRTGTLSAGSLVKPSKVTGLTGRAKSTTSVLLSWEMVDQVGGPAQTYRIYRDGTLLSAGGAVDALEFEDATCTPGVAYSYVVSGYNDSGEGIKSDAVSVTCPISNPLNRTRIREAVKLGLKTIIKGNVVGDYAYRNTVSEVGDPPKSPAEFRELPGVNIFPGNENSAEGAVIPNGDNRGLLHNSFEMRLEIYFNSVDDPALAQEGMAADIKAYFGNNNSIPDINGDATAFNCIYQGWEPYGLNLDSPKYGITITFKVWYRESIKNPTQLT